MRWGKDKESINQHKSIYLGWFVPRLRSLSSCPRLCMSHHQTDHPDDYNHTLADVCWNCSLQHLDFRSCLLLLDTQAGNHKRCGFLVPSSRMHYAMLWVGYFVSSFVKGTSSSKVELDATNGICATLYSACTTAICDVAHRMEFFPGSIIRATKTL